MMSRVLNLLLVLILGVLAPVYSNQLEYNISPQTQVTPSVSESEQNRLEDIYRSLSVPDFSYQHDVDPDQYYDIQNTTWSPYPLLRLNSALYFKNLVIEPGYYLLTPRKKADKWYLLFKEAGKVKYIIPVYERGYTPESFYDENIPKPELTAGQKVRNAVTNFAGLFKSSKRPKEKRSYLEVNDLHNNFLQLILYWGDFKYYTIYRTVPL